MEQDGYTNVQTHDVLTGLLAPEAFYERVRRLLDSRPEGRYLLLRGDLDRFKIFNDIFGASEGDKLLAYIGKKIIQDSPAGVFGARLRADHFITCWPKALFHAGKTMEHVMGWLEAYPVQYKFSVRLGIYLIEEPELCVQRMCDRALLAASVDKGSYVSKYVYYDSALREQMLEEQALIMDLGKALEERQFELYFQPQYDYTTMEMVGVEALVRWNHPRRGFLLPNAFVPAFERSGLITSLDLYVWEEACRCLRAWMDEYPEDEPVSLAVNLSRLDIYDRTICEKITGIVRKYGLSPALLRLEITESAYMDLPEQMIQAVKQLQDAGFVLEMDDFGKGYSSLNMLKDVPVDILKLDMHFLDTKKSDRGSTILRSVVRMAHWLSLCTIAEGVETREQADFLLSIGCRYMQGYYFARPMPRAEFEAMALAGKRAPIERSGGKAFPVGQRTLRQAGCPNAQVVNCYMGAAQLEAVVKGVPGGLVLYEVGREIRTLFFNDAAAALSGHTRQEYRELTREDALALAHEEDAARMREGMRTLAAAAPRIDLVYRIRHKDGGCRWVRLSGTVTRREEEAVYVSAVLLDVTDEKKIEALAAQREQERYRFILQHMGAAVFEWDLATGETYASAEYEEYGLSQLGPRVLAANADPRALACPADWDMTEAFFDEIRKGATQAKVTVRLAMKEGGFRWSRITAYVVRDEDGAAKRVIGTIFDLEDEANAWRETERLEKRLSNIVRNLPLGVGIYEKREEEVVAIYLSDVTCAIFGVTQEAYWDSILRNTAMTVMDDVHQKMAETCLVQLPSMEKASFELKTARADGSPVWVRVICSAVSEAGPHPLLYAAIIDISEEIKARRTELWQGERYRILTDLTHAMSFDYDVETDTMDFYFSTGRGTQKKRVEHYQASHLDSSQGKVHPDCVPLYRSALQSLQKGQRRGVVEYRADYWGDGYQWYRANWIAISTGDGAGRRAVGVVENIQGDKDLRVRAEYDVVTGLLNRATTEELVASILAKPEPCVNCVCAVADIDNFKAVNDTYGHLCGDKVLREVGALLRSCCRHKDVVGRVGGDEFVLFLQDIPVQTAVKKLGDLVRQLGQMPLRLPEGQVTVSLSVGLCSVTGEDTTYAAAFDKADKALYRAKHRGKGCVAVYHPADA